MIHPTDNPRVDGVFSIIIEGMTDTPNTNPERSLPENSAAADKVLKPKVMIFSGAIFLLLVGMTILAPYVTFKMRVPNTSVPALIVDFISVAIIMGVFFYGSNRLAKSLTDYGRNFVKHGQWEDAEYVLNSFNNWGQHFLDVSGEAHYLLSIALQKRGKYETARKVREFVVKNRANSEWAEKIQSDVKARAVPTPSTRPEDNPPKLSKPKRRRY